jgi:hypothetical protein
MTNPETLRTYAAILEKPARGADGVLRPPGEMLRAAAAALRFQADATGYVLCYAGVPAAWRVKPEDMPERQAVDD